LGLFNHLFLFICILDHSKKVDMREYMIGAIL